MATEKDLFLNWTIKKIEFNSRDRGPFFGEREVWWAVLGKNIGQETNGKNFRFERPVLIIKKYSLNKFFGLPLTTQIHPYFLDEVVIDLNSRKMAVSLSQGRTLSAKRLVNKLGVLSIDVYYGIIKSFKKQF